MATIYLMIFIDIVRYEFLYDFKKIRYIANKSELCNANLIADKINK